MNILWFAKRRGVDTGELEELIRSEPDVADTDQMTMYETRARELYDIEWSKFDRNG